MKSFEQIRQTSIPLGLNRFLLLAVVAVVCLINGPVVLNWPPVRSMYVRAGVYAWQCDTWDDLDEMTCPEQRKSLALLATLGQTLMFAGSVVGGFVADKFGPKTATVSGSCLFALHYLMIAVSSQSVQLYIPAYVCQGFGIEMSYFGVLNVSNLFPRNKAFAMSIMGAFRSMAMAYCIVQRSVASSTNLRTTNLLCMTLAIIMGAAAFFVLPNQAFILIEDDQEATEPTVSDKNVSTLPDAVTPSTASNDSRVKAIEYDDEKAKKKDDWRLLRSKALKPVYIAWLFFFTVAYTRYTFFGISLQDQMPDAVRAYSILSPLSFIPCPILGFLGDRIGMLWVIGWLNVVGTVIYICLLSPHNAGSRWIAVLGASCVASFLASQNYCYIAKAYPDRLAGRLSGLAMLVAGLVSLVNTPLYNWATDRGQFRSVDWIWFSLSLCLFGCLALMYFKRKTTKALLPLNHPTEDLELHFRDQEQTVV